MSDLNAFVSTTTGYNKSPTQPESWWRANVNLFEYFSWRAVGEVYDPSVPNYVHGTPYRYEIEEVWNSGDLTAFNSQITLPSAFLREGRTYRARVKFQDSGGRSSHWSEPVQFTAGSSGAAQLAQSLIVSELMYNPPPRGAVSGDEFEFIELKNIGANTLDLGGLAFTAGINFTFANGTTLAPDATFLLVRNPAQLASKYPGVVVNGVYSGKLDNGGETLTLSHLVGGAVLSFAYDDAAPWPVAPDSFDFSLVPVNPTAPFEHSHPVNWRASNSVGGSPGSDDPPKAIPSVLVNEVLSHSETGADFIELFNPTTNSVDLGGWFLTDDPNTPKKFRIPPNTMIGPMAYLAFVETQFNPTPGTINSFSLIGRGDDVYLFGGDAVTTNLTGYTHGFVFAAQAEGVTFGRHVTSTGEEHFPAQLSGTPGLPNSGPRVGPIVITEIHYHPVPGGDEFIELKNISANAVPLFDPAHPANTWKLNGIGYTFPANLTLGAGNTLLLVATNPATFRARHSIAATVEILGPYPGQLQGSGERLELQQPDDPDPSGLAFITVEEVRYNDRAPWPFAADGSGASLQRKNSGGYGNDPGNWVAATPTPGGEFTTPLSFAGWAARFDLSGASAAADADPDSDGLPNGPEYILGGNPKVPATSEGPAVTTNGGTMVFTFPRDDESETPDVTLTVETGTDLMTWPTVFAIGPTTAASSPGVTVAENGTAPDTVTVTIAQGPETHIFARLKVTIAP